MPCVSKKLVVTVLGCSKTACCYSMLLCLRFENGYPKLRQFGNWIARWIDMASSKQVNWFKNTFLLCALDINERAEILRLRRRFLKDQEKLSVIYARKGVAEQKREKVCLPNLLLRLKGFLGLFLLFPQS